MDPNLLKLILETLTYVAGSTEDSTEIKALQSKLAEKKEELADALKALQEVDRPDTTRSDADLRRALGTIGIVG